ncbi:MAG: L,D-transpeptidase [Aminobacteriaceae bacterium]
MYYGRRRSPEWVKQAVVMVVLFIIAVFAWRGYHLVRPVPVDEEALSLSTEEIPLESAMRPEEVTVLNELPELPPIPVSFVREYQPVPPSLPPVPQFVAGPEDAWLHVVKGRMKMYYYRGDSVEREYSIATGANGGQKQRVGDNRTPVGSFTVQQIQDSRKWTYDFGDGNGPVRGAYGPWFIRLRTPGWRGIGIHGTHDPGSIGTMATQGCVRLRNEDIEELKGMVFVGMVVIITER